MGQNALLLLPGEYPHQAKLKKLVHHSTFVLAADGAADTALKKNIRVDAVLGDLDSVSRRTLHRFARSQIIRRKDQSKTDFEKSLEYLIKHQFKNVDVVGAAGGRLDFTIGHFHSVWKYLPKLSIRFIGPNWLAIPFIRNLNMALPIGTRVSLLPYATCTKLNLSGFQWNLKNATWKMGDHGLSNRTVKSVVQIRCASGKLLFIAEIA